MASVVLHGRVVSHKVIAKIPFASCLRKVHSGLLTTLPVWFLMERLVSHGSSHVSGDAVIEGGWRPGPVHGAEQAVGDYGGGTRR